MESGNQPNQTEIFDVATSCLQQFHDYTTDSNENLSNVRILEQRFKVWAQYSGAISRPAVSLDARLEGLPDLKRGILGLLHMIAAHLNQDKFKESNGQKAFSESPWQVIATTIDMLLEAVSVIRDQSSQSRDSRAPDTYSRPDDAYFEQMLEVLMRNQFPKARLSLTKHVARSIFVRRRRLLWHQNHTAKLNFPRSQSEHVTSSRVTASNPRPTDHHALGLFRKLNENTQNDLSPAPAPSSTNISRPNVSSIIQRRLKAPTVVSGITRGSIVGDRHTLELPEPPVLSEGQEYYVCPYCDKPLSKPQLEKTLWRQHVYKDLQPYVCISERCQNNLVFFISKSEWANHMKTEHGQDWYTTIHMKTWRCSIDGTEDLEFMDAESYHEHLAGHKVSENRANVMVRHDWGMGQRLPGTCPFCEAQLSKNLAKNMDALETHIADHLSNIALLSLPTLDAQAINDLDRNSADAEMASDTAPLLSERSVSHISTLLPPTSRTDFRIAIMCAEVLEAQMVVSLFDADWSAEGHRYENPAGDYNAYSFGLIAGHNIVLLNLHSMVNTSTTAAVIAMRVSFPSIDWAFLVGTCGVVPTHPQTEDSIFLGDCLFSTSIIEYDFGRRIPRDFIKQEIKTTRIRTALPAQVFLAKLSTPKSLDRLNYKLARFTQNLIDLSRITQPQTKLDRLFLSSSKHSHAQDPGSCDECFSEFGLSAKDCEAIGCKDEFRVRWGRKDYARPKLHFGSFGSAKIVLRSGEVRDELAHDDNIIAFETVGVDFWEYLPAVMIKSACDYADNYKDKIWQPYAAATAAAGLKVALSELELSDPIQRNARVTDFDEERQMEVSTSPHTAGIHPERLKALQGLSNSDDIDLESQRLDSTPQDSAQESRKEGAGLNIDNLVGKYLILPAYEFSDPPISRKEHEQVKIIDHRYISGMWLVRLQIEHEEDGRDNRFWTKEDSIKKYLTNLANSSAQTGFETLDSQI